MACPGFTQQEVAMISTRRFPSLFLKACLCAAVVLPCAALAQGPIDEAAGRAQRHQSADWLALEPHLPDATTGTATALEVAADVMRARRMPEDALDYYRFALNRGGDEGRLLRRIGVTELELHRPAAARAALNRAVLLNKKDAEGWNDLGAAEYVNGAYAAAIFDYQKALKISKKTAVYHSNLGTAYFEVKDYESARTQFTQALKLDPAVFRRGGWGGIEAHVLSPQDRGRFCFEMAILAAHNHDDVAVVRWLTQASETGYDVKWEMKSQKDLVPYLKDARVDSAVKNAKAMRAGQIAVAVTAPALPAEGAKVD